MWGVTAPPYNMNRTGSPWAAVEASYPYPARMEGSLRVQDCHFKTLITSVLKLRAAGSFAMLIFTDNTTKCHKPQNHNLHFFFKQNKKKKPSIIQCIAVGICSLHSKQVIPVQTATCLLDTKKIAMTCFIKYDNFMD